MNAIVDPSGFEQRIEAVRRFNRFYTRLIGLIGDRILHSRFTLTEARVLFELATRETPTAAIVARDLGLDPGYLSRILARFEQSGLLARSPSADRRRALLSLTADGRATFAPIDASARAQIGQLLGTLPDHLQAELVHAMGLIERRLGRERQATRATLRAHRPGDIGWLIGRHGEIYAREYGFGGMFEAFVARVAADFLAAHDPARERCWIAEVDGLAAGSIMLVRASDELAKLRLLIVEPDARGLGVGRDLVETCIGFARDAGYGRVTLWTHDILHAARQIYARAGFRLVRSEPHRLFGPDLVGEDWELALR